MPTRFRAPERFTLVKGRPLTAVGAVILCLALLPGLTTASGVKRPIPVAPQVPPAPPSTGKLSPDLLQLVGALSSMSPEQRVRASALRANHVALPVLKVAGPGASWLQIYLYPTDTSEATLEALANQGVLIEQVQTKPPLVQGYVRIQDVECLAELPCVTFLSRPNYSICNAAQRNAGQQGLYGTEAYQLMEIGSMGLDGTGTTIGVLSVGLFDDLNPAPQSPTDDRRVASQDFPQRDPNGLLGKLGGIEVMPYQDPAVHLAPVPSQLLYLPLDLALKPLTEPPEPVDYYQQRPPIWRQAQANEGIPGQTPGSLQPRATGALMLEILHDLAPNARLVFGSARTDVEFYHNRERIVNEQIANVVVDDVGFPGLGRYDGSSALSKRATQLVRERNVVCVTAVGDYTPPNPEPTPSPTPTPAGATPTPFLTPTPPPQEVRSAGGKPLFINTFFNPDPRNFSIKSHSFMDPASPGRDETLEIQADPDLGFFEAFLVWDDVWVDPLYVPDELGNDFKIEPAGRATDDLDLYIVNRETMDLWRPIAFSNFIQNGRSANPVERVITTDSSTNMSLVIRRKNPFDNRPTFMTLVITAGTVEEPEYLTHGVPLCNSDALGGVISVGAIDVKNTNANVTVTDTIPGHSPGRGAERYARFLQWRSGGQKPDLCCYENVSTFTGGERGSLSLNYLARGSSIAAAHVAGFCALLRQYQPGLTADRYLSILSDTNPPPGDTDPLHANSVPIMTEIPVLFGNAPRYKRLEAGNVYRNLSASTLPPGSVTEVSVAQAFIDGPGLWTHGPIGPTPFYLPEFEFGEGRLTIRSSKTNTFGYWESPVLEYVDPDTQAPSGKLDSGKTYRATVRISCSQPDPNRVPDFRVRLITTSVDEAVELVVNSMSSDGTNAPRDGLPRDYVLYYQPTPEAALYGVRVAIDMINFNPKDDPAASLYIHDTRFEQFNAPPASTPVPSPTPSPSPTPQ